MDLGLVCPRCARLSPLSATECRFCQSVLWQQQEPETLQAQEMPSAVAVGESSPPKAPPSLPSMPPPPQHPPANHGATEPSPEGPPELPDFGTDTAARSGPILTPAETKIKASLHPSQGQTQDLGSVDSEELCPRVVLIKGGAQDGVTYRLGAGEHTLGRRKADICFDNDEFLSSPHARFISGEGQLAVEDIESENGIFLRIRSPTPLSHDDCFLVGEQLLRIDTRPVPQFAPNERGTYFYGSPRPKGPFRIVQCLAGGGDGRCQSAASDSMSIGRENSDFSFPKDRFISGHHARVELDASTDRLFLHDLRSRNGTFLRIRGRYILRHGDYLFIGQQLFRIELSSETADEIRTEERE